MRMRDFRSSWASDVVWRPTYSEGKAARMLIEWETKSSVWLLVRTRSLSSQRLLPVFSCCDLSLFLALRWPDLFSGTHALSELPFLSQIALH